MTNYEKQIHKSNIDLRIIMIGNIYESVNVRTVVINF